MNRTLKVAQGCLVRLEMIDVHVNVSDWVKFLSAALCANVFPQQLFYLHVCNHAYTHGTNAYPCEKWPISGYNQL